MAIQKEIWQSAIVEGLFADDSFLSKAVNDDQWVNQGHVVHIPQAGAPSAVEKNRATLPAEIKTRTDTDLTYVLSEFTTDPVRIDHADTVELSYSKVTSILSQDRLALMEKVAEDFIFNWSPAADHTLETSGDAIDAYTSKATGKRRAIVKADVLKLMTAFNEENIPQEGRYLLLDAQMYSQLLNDLTANENSAFLASANAQQGVLGKLYSFNIMMRSKSALYTTAKAPKNWATTGAATDLAAALAWHTGTVSRALGAVEAFEQQRAPEYYGDIYSFLVRCGGRIRRADMRGIRALVQGTPTSA